MCDIVEGHQDVPREGRRKRRVRLAEFLPKAGEALLKRIEEAPDGVETLYPPKTARDCGDRNTSNVAARFMGVECADRHEVWLTLWSRNPGELAAMAEFAEVLSDWTAQTDPESGAVFFRRSDADIILAFDEEDGSATFIYAQRGRTIPFKKNQFLERAKRLLDEALAIVTRFEATD
jgi:hypothetical protein